MPRKPAIEQEEKKRLGKLRHMEEKIRREGYASIAGVDEAGRGPLAGPVVAAACIIPKGIWFPGVDDSKKLSPEKRHSIFQEICNHPEVIWGVGIVNNEEIDRINILQATFSAMKMAVNHLYQKPDLLLVDGFPLKEFSIPSRGFPKGDGLYYSIAAASIIAKETRDSLMREYHKQWPEYRFDLHKGYGTEFHRSKIIELGICSIHRRSFINIDF